MRFNGFAEWFARHRMLLVVFVVTMTITAVVGLLRVGFDDLPLNIFKSDQADFELLQELFADFGSDDGECIVVVESDQLFSPQGVKLLRALTEEISKIDQIESVRSMDDVVVVRPGRPLESILPKEDASPEDFTQARGDVLAHPMLGGHLVSLDGHTTIIMARIRGNSLSISEIKPTVAAVREAIARVDVPEDFARVRLTGVPPIRYEIFSSIRRDSSRFMIIGTFLAFIMATALFRRFWAVMTVAIPPLLAAMWTIGLLGLSGEKFNVINTILPVLVMIVGFTDSVHLMMDIRHSLARGLAPLDAAKSAIEHLGIACAITSFTTAIGFASLMVTNVEVIRKLGIVCAIGAVLAFTSTITLVPLLASSPIGRHLAYRPSGGRISNAISSFTGWIRRLSERAIDWVIAHAGFVTVAGILTVCVLGGLVTQLEPNNRLTESIPEGNESAQALFHLDDVFGGMLASFVLVDWDENKNLGSEEVLAAVDEVQQMIDKHPGANHPISILNVLKSLPGPEGDLASKVPLLGLVPPEVVRRFALPERRRTAVVFYLEDVGTGVHEPTFRDIEQSIAEIESRHEGLTLNLTGTVVVASRNINQMITDLAKSLGLATVVIFITLGIVFRSWKLGLISIVPNVFPLAATASWLVITGQPLQLTSVIVFSICLGIAVDDTIHVINRFQREMTVDGDVPAAIKRTFMAVGSALATTTVVLVVGFVSVAMSEMPPSQIFAKLGSIAIFSALLGDLIILPAMLVFFLGRNPKAVPSMAIPNDGEEPLTDGVPAAESRNPDGLPA